MSARALASGVAAVLAVMACTAPRVVEDSPLACLNGIDDDGNGLTDCADPACAGSGVCETSFDACRNGLDDNRDGKVDCEDPACIQGGFCEAFDTPCTPHPESGCPRGMACYPRRMAQETFGMLCARPGAHVDDEPCTSLADCRAGLFCDTVCSSTCLADEECPRESRCIRVAFDAFGFGVCTHPCAPLLQNCTAGECVTAHRYGHAFDGADFLAFCVVAPPPWHGTVKVGEICADPVPIADLARMCADDLVCVPGADGVARCRATCAFRSGELLVKCVSPAETCLRPHPLDKRTGGPYTTGVCVP